MNSNRQQVTIQKPEGDSIKARRVIRNVARNILGFETGQVFVNGTLYDVERGPSSDWKWYGQFVS